ncbi:MAG: ROK family protein [Prevotella sp.]|nr:ROK family protein [Prevotella sp.]
MIQYTTKKCVVGVNISLYTTTYAIVDVRGDIIAQDEFPTQEHPNINEFVAFLSERLVELMEANGGYDAIRSVGVGVLSGNFVKGSIQHSPSLPWKGEVPLASMLRDRLGMAVAVGNNAHARALGEHAFGSAHGMRDFIVITLGPGLGSCFFSNGRPHLGNDGFAGEVGHVCVKPNGRHCGCGGRGCLETYCAEQGVIRTAKKLMTESGKPSLMNNYENLTPKDITACCEQGDELAIETYRITGELLGLGMANYASVVNPEAIIFTGGISKAGHWLFDPAREVFEENVFHNLRGKVKFLTSTLTDIERSILGASALAWEVQEYSLFK